EPDHAPVLDAHAVDQGVRAEREVVAAPHRRAEVAARRAHPLAGDLVHRVRTDTGRGRVVVVGAVRRAEGARDLDERTLPRYELARRVAANRDGAASAVPLGGEGEGVLEPLERRQAALEAPLGETQRGPLVVVVGLAAQRYAGVHRRGAADDAAARKVEQHLTRGRAVAQAPVVAAERV